MARMETYAGKSRDAFNAGQSPAGQSDPVQFPAMAFIIDIQGVGNMNEEDAKNYLGKLAESIALLRANNVPVTWVTMGKRNHLYEPQMASGSPSNVRKISDLVAMGFDGAEPGHKGHELFAKFLEDHGPRTDEAVYSKFYKSAFVDPEDHANRPELEEVLRSDYTEGMQLPQPGEFSGPTLTQYAKARGVTKPLILGAVSTHCVSETATWAVLKGMKPTIATDGVLSWAGKESEVNPRVSYLIWSHGESAPESFHAGKINTRLDEILADDRRGLSGADKSSIREVGFSTVQGFITSLSKPSPVSEPVSNSEASLSV